MDTAHLPLQENLIRALADPSEDLQPMLHLDAVVALADITPALVAELGAVSRMGRGTPRPVLCPGCPDGLSCASPWPAGAARPIPCNAGWSYPECRRFSSG